ncbi:hypothetical protein QR680_002716 [Steinernema hermaphroditum]|uniref:Vitellogenin domain-containing protein n=1 Tax=Steinernema hermaphroditum TaxID=289476 RepID=A0AA39LIQ0_9BILA|nr:hypothetical protein QR680_002716 [Steinernema hermaphroditum]
MKWLLVFGLCALAFGSSAYPSDQERSSTLFEYRTQVATGIPSASDLHSITQFSAKVAVSSTGSENFLQLSDIEVGVFNDEVKKVDQLLPKKVFKKIALEQNQLEELRLPVKFYKDHGLVMNIIFDERDSMWSKNLKKAVLSHFSANSFRTNPRKSESVMELIEDAKKEVTLEGECNVLYTAPKEWKKTDDSQKQWSITKTVDFSKCKQAADVSYDNLFSSFCSQDFGCKNATDAPLRDRAMYRSSMFSYVYSEKQWKKIDSFSRYVVHNVIQRQNIDIVTSVVTKVKLVAGASPNTPEKPRNGKDESLLYSAEIDRLFEKFLMQGDDALRGEKNDWALRSEEFAEIKQMLKEVANSADDKNRGISFRNTMQYQKLVHSFRRMTVDDLKKVYEDLYYVNSPVAKELYMNILAAAGSYNTFQTLHEKVITKEVDTEKLAAQLLQMVNIRKPSKKIIDQFVSLCKNKNIFDLPFARQSCWLSIGPVVNKWLKMEKREESEKRDILLPFMDLYHKSSTPADKVIALKALANAGLDVSIGELEKILYDTKAWKIVRMQAIDSLRHLRDQIPTKIHKLLLPIFQDNSEKPEIRMSAFSMIMHSRPDASVLGHVVKVLIEEPKSHVAAFVYSMTEALAKSSHRYQRKTAFDLKYLIDRAALSSSSDLPQMYFHVPMYSEEKQSGAFLSVSQFSDGLPLPKKFALGLDAFFSGEWQQHFLQLEANQENVEKSIEKVVEFMNSKFEADWEEPTVVRGDRLSAKTPLETLKTLTKNLRIKSRESKSEEPLVMLQVRVANMDKMVYSVDLTLIEKIIKLVESANKSGKMKGLLEHFVRNWNQFVYQTATNHVDTLLKVPTSSGFPLAATSIYTSIVSLKGRLEESDWRSYKMEATLSSALTSSRFFKTEVETPFATTGAETTQAVEINAPLHLKAELVDKKDSSQKTSGIKMSYKTPEQKQRVFGFHTIPVTFVRVASEEIDEMKTIHNRDLAHTEHTIDEQYFAMTGLPLRVRGNGYALLGHSKPLEVIFAGRNHYEIYLEPTTDTPKSLDMMLLYSSPEAVMSRRSTSRWNDDVIDIDDHDSDFYPEQSAQQNDKHRVQIILEASDRVERKVEAVVEFKKEQKQLKGAVKIVRTPIREYRETSPWSLDASLSINTPEDLKSLTDIVDKKVDPLHGNMVLRWGPKDASKQQMNIELTGDQSDLLRDWVRTAMSQLDNRSSRPELLQKAAIFDQFKLKVQYKVADYVKNMLYSPFLGYIRMNNALSSTVQTMPSDILAKSEVYIKMTFDKDFRHYYNLSIEMPTEKINFYEMELPFALPSLSSKDVLEPHRMMMPGKSRECIVERNQLTTFNGLVSQMPMDSNDCNTVIVKDCSRGDEEDARPKFAVLLKNTDSRTGLKKLTIHTDKVIIEAERESPYEEIFHIRVNGRETTDIDRLESIGIRVREGNFDFENAYVKVQFDGRRLSTRVSKLFKNHKCGLCTMERDSFDDMFTLADNTKTSEMSRFHQSYIEETKECSVDHHEMNQERYEMDGEDDLWDSNARSGYEHVSPIEQTAVIERSEEMCFSKKLVKKCPKGSSPKETERKRVQFVCVERSSPVARRLLRQTERPIEEWRLDVINRFNKNLDIPVLCEA